MNEQELKANEEHYKRENYKRVMKAIKKTT